MKKTSPNNQALRFSLSLCLLLLFPFETRAWGRKGHHVVARIAFLHLSEKSKTAITNLLQADQNDKEHCAQQTSLASKFSPESVANSSLVISWDRSNSFNAFCSVAVWRSNAATLSL